jgi:hypothetical protein
MYKVSTSCYSHRARKGSLYSTWKSATPLAGLNFRAPSAVHLHERTVSEAIRTEMHFSIDLTTVKLASPLGLNPCLTSQLLTHPPLSIRAADVVLFPAEWLPYHLFAGLSQAAPCHKAPARLGSGMRHQSNTPK